MKPPIRAKLARAKVENELEGWSPGEHAQGTHRSNHGATEIRERPWSMLTIR